MKTKELLTEHFGRYPKCEIQDIFKFIHQSSFGCEHMVSSLDRAVEYIKSEYENGILDANIEPLDGEYSRVYLSWLNNGLSTATLARIFCLSAKVEADGGARLVQKLDIASELIAEGVLPLDKNGFETALAEWRDMGYPAVHHSDTFREVYRPAYRVVADKYARYLELFASIDKLISAGALPTAIAVKSEIKEEEFGQILEDVYDNRVAYRDGLLIILK